jgi:ABC-2 type transport system permease protein
MGRLERVLRRYWATALGAELEYPLNLLIELLVVAGNVAGSLFVLSLFYGQARSLGGWSWNGALVVLGAHTVLDGLASTLLQPNLSRIVTHVQRGTLDFVLLQPIDSQLQVSLRTLSPWGLPGIALGLALMLTGAARSGALGQPLPLLAAALLLLAGGVILYGLWFLLAATSIWFVKVWNATEVLRAVLVAGRYPVSAYPPALRILFTLVLPIAFLTTVPAAGTCPRRDGAGQPGGGRPEPGAEPALLAVRPAALHLGLELRGNDQGRLARSGRSRAASP